MFSDKNIAVAYPGIINSRGHEITTGNFFVPAFCEAANLDPRQLININLKPKDFPRNLSGRVCEQAWAGVENAKSKLAAEAEGLLESVAGKIIGPASTLLRNSNFFNTALTNVYRQQVIDINPDLLISSHYLSFFGLGSQQMQRIFVAPDVFPQPAVENLFPQNARPEDTPQIVSSSSIYTNDLLRLKIPEDHIHTTGLVLPHNIYAAINPRLEKQAAVNRGEAEHQALVSIGASGPEKGQVRQLVNSLVEQRINTTVLVGDGRAQNVAFREVLLEDQAGRSIDRHGLLNLLGGTSDCSRADELAMHAEALACPGYTLFAARPGEMAAFVGAAAGILLEFDPYQHHEAQARNALVNESFAHPAANIIRGGEQIALIKFNSERYADPDFPFKPCTGEQMLEQLFVK